ncbi:MAG: tetratricopeptide repeat protein [Deltaproteobacteria bacterium]|nr:tetratricopeptide repeat protein [Deltaproteobacteria bacterium]MBW2154576.1 tetratricopeptide repeat protein [Deltaproteobacteria bacterium]
MRYQSRTLFHEAVSAQINGDVQSALRLYNKLLKKIPAHVPALNNVGGLHLASGNFRAAVECFKKALKYDPESGDAWNNLGTLLLKFGDAKTARECFEKALSSTPQDPVVLTNLGSALKELGCFNEAIACHRQSLESNPLNAKAYNNLALVYKETQRFKEAVTCLKNALKLDAKDSDIYFNLGQLLAEQGRFEEAVSLSQEAIKTFPDSISTMIGAARVLIESGHWETANSLLPRILNHEFTVSELPALRHLLLFLNASDHFTGQIARLHFKAGKLIEDAVKITSGKESYCFTGRFDGLKRLRIGYVSADFNCHPVGLFFREISKRYDRKKFEFFCYSLSRKTDELTEKIIKDVTVFRNVAHLSNLEIARCIFEDRIQILIDLAGYTSNNRMDLFALRPAPVQVTAIGYPHGTGLSTIDYRITDKAAEGPEADKEYREGLIRLPVFFLPFPAFVCKERGFTKSDLGIPAESVTFVSFNALHKLRPEVLQLWNRILQQNPNSSLIFSFKYSNLPYLQSRIRDYFDIDPNRLLFIPQTETQEQHRARYRLADIALDPFPYNGTTTSWEALCMGVPVVTLMGDRHVQRTTWSLLAHLGLEFLAAADTQEYLHIASELACKPAWLREVRDKVKKAADNALTTGNREYIKHLQKAFLNIWHTHSSMSLLH